MNGEQYFQILAKAIHKEDEQTISTLLDKNFVLYEDEGLPYGGVYRGTAGFSLIRRLVFNIWRERQVDCVTIIGSQTDQSFSIVLRMTGKLDHTEAVSETFVSEVWNVVDGKAQWARVWYSNANVISERCRDRYDLLKLDAGTAQ